MNLRTITQRLVAFLKARTLHVVAAPILICLAAGVGEGAVIINISDDGTNLTMSATGDFDLTNATPTGSSSSLTSAIILPSSGIIGWDTNGTQPLYRATFSGALTGSRVNFPSSSSTTTNPFFFWGQAQAVVFTGGLTGSVNESAILANTTVASAGLVAGETLNVSWGNGGVNERGTVNVLATAVPEPSTLTLLGLAGAGGLLALRRRRKAT